MVQKHPFQPKLLLLVTNGQSYGSIVSLGHSHIYEGVPIEKGRQRNQQFGLQCLFQSKMVHKGTNSLICMAYFCLKRSNMIIQKGLLHYAGSGTTLYGSSCQRPFTGKYIGSRRRKNFQRIQIIVLTNVFAVNVFIFFIIQTFTSYCCCTSSTTLKI